MGRWPDAAEAKLYAQSVMTDDRINERLGRIAQILFGQRASSRLAPTSCF